MDSIHSEFFRNNVSTIILSSLYEEDRYGFDILREIDQKSQGKYNIKQATLYSCLKRLEKGGFLKAFWGSVSSGGRRRYYSLTSKGREYLNKNKNEYEFSRTLLDKLVSDKQYDLSESPPFNVNELRPRERVMRAPKAPAAAPLPTSIHEDFDAYADAADAKQDDNLDDVASDIAGDDDFEFLPASTDLPAASSAKPDAQNSLKNQQISFFDSSDDDNDLIPITPPATFRSQAFDNQSSPKSVVNNAEQPSNNVGQPAAQSSIFDTERQPQSTLSALSAEGADNAVAKSQTPVTDTLPPSDMSNNAANDADTKKQTVFSFTNPGVIDHEQQFQAAKEQQFSYNDTMRAKFLQSETRAMNTYDIVYSAPIDINEAQQNDEPAAPAIPAPPVMPASRFIYEEPDLKSEYEKRDTALQKLGIGKYKDQAFDKMSNSQTDPKAFFYPEKYSDQTAKTAEFDTYNSVRIFENRPNIQFNQYQSVSQEDIGISKSNSYSEYDKDYNAQFVTDNTDEPQKAPEYLDDNTVKFQEFERYSAHDPESRDIRESIDKSSNYKAVFSEEILTKSRNDSAETSKYQPSPYNRSSDSGTANSAAPYKAQRSESPVYYGDVKTKLTNDGYEVRTYNKSNTADFYSKNYIYKRKLDFHTMGITYLVWLAQILLMWLVLDVIAPSFLGLTTAAALLYIFVPLVLPLYFGIMYLIEPGKRTRDDFAFKKLLQISAIVAASIFVVTALISIFALGAFAAENPTWGLSLLMPFVLLSNVPLYVYLFEKLRKTKKYNLG